MTNDSIDDIWEKLNDIANALNNNDVYPEKNDNKSYLKSNKFKRKTKKGENNHKIFLYLYLTKSKKHVRILFDTGSNPKNSLDDKKGITKPCTGWKNTIPRQMRVTPDKINNKDYTYDDIRDLMYQCYKTLNNPK